MTLCANQKWQKSRLREQLSIQQDHVAAILVQLAVSQEQAAKEKQMWHERWEMEKQDQFEAEKIKRQIQQERLESEKLEIQLLHQQLQEAEEQ